MIDSNLLKYIQAKQSIGETQEQICASLLTTGWKQEVIDEAYTFINQEDTNALVKKSFFSGRIGALHYFLSAALIFCIQIIVSYFVNQFYFPLLNTVVLACMFIVLAIVGVSLQIRRAHDKGHSGWFILLAFVPLVNLIWFIHLLFPGDKGINAYGAPVPKDKDFISDLLNR